MKSIKYVMLGVFISFIIFFVIGIIYSNINRNNKIHINDYQSFNESITSLSTKIDKVKDDTCRSSLNYMKDRIVSNHLTGDVSLKDYYESFYKDDLTILDYYEYIKTSCNLEHNNKIYNLGLSSLVYPEYIKNKYNRSYEIYFKDYMFKDKNIDDMGTYSTIINELSMLSSILEELK